ncbi:hypothetical protein BGZ46_010398 [Entomortierella lignicola]|nr:hypothetical protein BGZ46_010398 [Entomortierella lignicola]
MDATAKESSEKSPLGVEAFTTTSTTTSTIRANTRNFKRRHVSIDNAAKPRASMDPKNISFAETSRLEQTHHISDSQPPGQQTNDTKGHHRCNQQQQLHTALSSNSPTASPKLKKSRKEMNLEATNTHQSPTQVKTRATSDISSENVARAIGPRIIPPTRDVEVVMKSVELQSPNTILRNRKTHGSTISFSSPEHIQEPTSSEDDSNNANDIDNNYDHNQNSRCKSPIQMECSIPGVAFSLPIQRKPSLSSVRGHVPSVINTGPGGFKLHVEESSPVVKSLKHAVLTQEKNAASGVGGGAESGGECTDEDDDFDWEEHDEVRADTDVNTMKTMMENDVCCKPLHQIHPYITRVLKNVLVVLLLFIPIFILKYVHAHHHGTIVLINSGRPYMAVVFGNYLSYFVIQLLTMGLFKIIHKFGSVKVKITLESHDGLVPHIARSVWLLVLTPFWVVFVHIPTCKYAEKGFGYLESITDDIGVDRHCHRWIFWWVHRCLWGLQTMNTLYIFKRTAMQIISDRFEQHNSKYVELNFQGHVLDGLQRIKHRNYRGLYSYRWAEKSTSWLASTYQAGKSPSMSRPNSSNDEKPPTATFLENTTQQRSIWALLRNSIRKRKKEKDSEVKSITEADHELKPQEFFRMSNQRKSKLINSLRNKPIENPYKKAKYLWLRICPPHRNHLERVDLEQPFKKEIMDNVWKLFNPGEGDIITRSMFKKTIVEMVNLRKRFTSTHKTFENAMGKLNMLFNCIVVVFAIVAFLVVYDIGVQQYAVSVSSLGVGCAFVTGTSAKNAFESMILIFVIRRKQSDTFDVGDRIELNGRYFSIKRIHILTTEMRRSDGLRVFAPNHLLANCNIHNLSRSDDQIDNLYMDIPLFSTARTIQRLKQRIQAFIEGEASADYLKIDVILSAPNNHNKEGMSRACLQVLFRVFHRCRFVDSTYQPRKLRAILFLRTTLNELEQEDLNDLIALRRAMGYGNHGPQGNQENLTQYPVQQPVLNEAGNPVGFVGTSGNVHDYPRGNGSLNTETVLGAKTGGQNLQSQGDLGAIYFAHQTLETMNQGSHPIKVDDQVCNADENPAKYPPDQDQGKSSEIDRVLLDQNHCQGENGSSSNHLDARHVLFPETIQLSINAANFQPFPNGFQFQR